MPRDPATFDREQERLARISRERSESGRDIARDKAGNWVYPEIESVRRRARCRNSLRLFCETYNPETFGLPWCADHLKAIARIEEAARFGALYGFALPRGSGKSVICRMAALWAVSYGLRRYVFVIGASQWWAEDSWPLPGTGHVPFYFHSRGHANSLRGDGALSPEPPGDEAPLSSRGTSWRGSRSRTPTDSARCCGACWRRRRHGLARAPG